MNAPSETIIEYPPAHSIRMLTRDILEKEILKTKVLTFPGPYIECFTHKSASKETHTPSLERLEFLGDAVISFIVAKHLFDEFPRENEGFLTRIRTKLTCSATLASLARVLQLHDFVIMNGMSMVNKWNSNDKTMEDVFEALVGALYIDKGLLAAKEFYLTLVDTYIDKKDLVESNSNYKDILNKFAQGKGDPAPVYVSTRVQSIIDNTLVYDTTVTVCGKTGRGIDTNKKKSEMKAAKMVLFEHDVKI